MGTVRLTVAQALVRFLANQYSERDGVEQRSIPGCFGIFGHGNVAGVGQALLEAHVTGSADLPYYLARNEQGMVHASVGYSRMRNRLQALACTASIGPGSTNMLTGAALATTNRIPVLLLASDIFATRVGSPVLQELELPRGYDIRSTTPSGRCRGSSTGCGARAAARGAARRDAGAHRPGRDRRGDARAAAGRAGRGVRLARGAVRQAGVAHPAAGARAGRAGRAVAVLRAARKPLIVAAAACIYSEATEALRRFAEATGIPVADTQAGKGAILWDHPQAVGGVGSTGSPVANALAREADVVLGIGTRYSDFTTASRTAFQNPDVRFVNLNVTALDAAKHAGRCSWPTPAGLEALAEALDGYRVDESYAGAHRGAIERVERVVDEGLPPRPPAAAGADRGARRAQRDRSGRTRRSCRPPAACRATCRCSGAQDPKQYHVEYAYSCMGYEIAGALGIKMAAPEREVYALVGDGSYLMMAQEIVTAVSEGIKLIVVIVQNHGFSSIGSLSESLGSQRFGTYYRFRNPETGLLNGDKLPIDLAANAGAWAPTSSG